MTRFLLTIATVLTAAAIVADTSTRVAGKLLLLALLSAAVGLFLFIRDAEL